MKQGQQVFSTANGYGTVIDVMPSGRVLVEWVDGYGEDAVTSCSPADLSLDQESVA